MERQEWTVRIHQRPWHEWVLWVVWVALLAFFANLWLASGSELEPQAATIGWVVFLVLLLIGVGVYTWERLMWRSEAP